MITFVIAMLVIFSSLILFELLSRRIDKLEDQLEATTSKLVTLQEKVDAYELKFKCTRDDGK